MRKHPIIGYEILQGSPSKFLQKGSEIALAHHERYDGTGYPYALRGNDIPLSARIVAVADVFDALTSIRPYKEAWSIDKALEYLRDESGKHFDPELVKAMLSMRDVLAKIQSEHATAIH
jgi:two-component system response regulator RpfG